MRRYNPDMKYQRCFVTSCSATPNQSQRKFICLELLPLNSNFSQVTGFKPNERVLELLNSQSKL